MSFRHLPDTDRVSAWRVHMDVRSRWLALLLLVFVACGGPPKPKASGGKAAASGGTAAPAADAGDATGAEAANVPPGPSPPGLDLTPEQRKTRVAGHVQSAQAALNSGNPNVEVAIREAQAALQVDEGSLEAMLALAHANYLKGYLELTEDILTKAESRGAGNRKELHFLKGLVFERTDRNDEALAAFERAVEIDDGYKNGLQNLAAHYLRNKRYQQASEILERLTGTLKVQDASVWTNLATAYRGLSADAAASDVTRRNALLIKAAATYDRALKANPNYGPAYYNLGLLYLDADPFPAGAKDMDKLERLTKARGYFEQYRDKPGANQKLADEQAQLAQKLYDREQLARKKLEDAERRRKEADEKAKNLENDEGGFE